jgi:hypothetical protein
MLIPLIMLKRSWAPSGGTSLSLMNFLELRYGEVRRIHLLKPYEKVSSTGKAPRHEATHGSIYERLDARTEILVVFAHPPVVVDPRKRAFHHPPPRQYQKTFGGQQFLPIYLHTLFGPLHQSTSLGAGLRGRSTSSPRSTPRSSPPNLCPCLRRGSRRPATALRRPTEARGRPQRSHGAAPGGPVCSGA